MNVERVPWFWDELELIELGRRVARHLEIQRLRGAGRWADVRAARSARSFEVYAGPLELTPPGPVLP